MSISLEAFAAFADEGFRVMHQRAVVRAQALKQIQDLAWNKADSSDLEELQSTLDEIAELANQILLQTKAFSQK